MFISGAGVVKINELYACTHMQLGAIMLHSRQFSSAMYTVLH